MIFPDRLNPETQSWMKGEGPRAIWQAMRDVGGEARVVGGAVRDSLLKRKIEDIDFAVNLPPEAVASALEKAGMKAVPTGLEYGTITAIVDKKGYEITSLRRDIETDGRHAKVFFTDDWQADAARRDFTFNALFLDEAGRIYDFTNGRADLAARRIRFIGSARERIAEDYLRILRFFRFLAQMSLPDESFTPDAEGLAACRELAAGLQGLSAERVSKEMFRLLSAFDPVPALRLMAQEGVLFPILPEELSIDRLARLTDAEKSQNISGDSVLRLAVLLVSGHGQAARRLKLSKAQSERIGLFPMRLKAFEKVANAKELRQFLYDHGPEAARDAALASIAEGSAAADFLPMIEKWEKPAFPIQGQDLLTMGLAAGPEVGKLLSFIEAWWREKDFAPSRAACLEEAKKKLNAR